MGSGAYVEGKMHKLRNEGQREIYEAGIKVKYRGERREVSKFTVITSYSIHYTKLYESR